MPQLQPDTSSSITALQEARTGHSQDRDLAFHRNLLRDKANLQKVLLLCFEAFHLRHWSAQVVALKETTCQTNSWLLQPSSTTCVFNSVYFTIRI